jgi:hypothetical protein
MEKSVEMFAVVLFAVIGLSHLLQPKAPICRWPASSLRFTRSGPGYL